MVLCAHLLMGVPVSGKNMFPFEHRRPADLVHHPRSKRHYIARKKEVDFLVAMNPETAKEDVLTLEPGGRGRLRRALKLNELRKDLIF